MAGAVSVAELEEIFAAAGFEEIRIEVRESSRKFIDEWVPGKRAGDYVASANIVASKPRS